MIIKAIETERDIFLSFPLEGYQHVLTLTRARELAEALERAADAAEAKAGTLRAEREAAREEKAA